MEDLEIYIHGKPDYNGLKPADKRALLLPLVENIQKFYRNPENRKEYEDWKAKNYPSV
ncbi:MAG: hypothetical protein FWC00_01225 [Firmicutes bacterium]|nr:hypothetical protein [Bacillota bacterium]